MKGTLKSFREQKRMIINLLKLFGEPVLIPAEYDWPFKNLRGESDPATTITPAAIHNNLFLTELFEATLQRMLGNCRFPCDSAETSRLVTYSLKAKVQNGLVFSQENGMV
jgi:hypothetical protein